jgi:DNA polymerase I-like protein with 3'-5' exonuclease and polymerase domains
MDLDSADLRVVVWESNCRAMKEMFQQGKKPYVECAKEYFRNPAINKQHRSYQTFKKFAHATNYMGKPPTIAGQCGLLVNEVDKLQKWYFGKCPEIKAWQDSLSKRFMATGTVENAYGYRCKWFGRLEGNAINEAVAWIPQSTIGLLINHIWLDLYENYPDLIQILLQVHDSLVGQFHSANADRALACIDLVSRRQLVPYPDPLYIPIGIKTSTKSWGEC